MHDHDLAVTNRPFALRPYEAGSEIEEKVVTLVIERAGDTDSQENRPSNDCVLSY